MKAVSSSDLPVTLIAGYLGSGKTTYINERLRNAAGVRYGVLVNDFGDLNIDESLIESEGVNTVSLTNGCVCCSLAHDVDGAIAVLEARRYSLDWILFEASGVADPSRLVSKLDNWPGLRLANSMTLVDVTRIKRLAQDKFVGGHIKAQLMSADDLYLTKTDLILPKEVDAISSWLASFQCENSGEILLDLPDFHSRVIRLADPISEKSFLSWLAKIPGSVVRVKGYVELESGVHLLQWVEGEYALTLQKSARDLETIQKGTNLVLIGTQLVDMQVPS